MPMIEVFTFSLPSEKLCNLFQKTLTGRQIAPNASNLCPDDQYSSVQKPVSIHTIT